MKKFVPLMLRLPPELHAALKKSAEKNMRSLNSEIVMLLRRELKKEK